MIVYFWVSAALAFIGGILSIGSIRSDIQIIIVMLCFGFAHAYAFAALALSKLRAIEELATRPAEPEPKPQEPTPFQAALDASGWRAIEAHGFPCLQVPSGEPGVLRSMAALEDYIKAQ